MCGYHGLGKHIRSGFHVFAISRTEVLVGLSRSQACGSSEGVVVCGQVCEYTFGPNALYATSQALPVFLTVYPASAVSLVTKTSS